jgi:DNA-directed RNA polymerase specialized sigma24 family protein
MDLSQESLMNYVNYSNVPVLRNLYKNFNKLKIAAESGNTTATCVYIDLMDGLSQLHGNQKDYVQWVLIEGLNQWEAGNKSNRSTSSVSISIEHALAKISNYLIEDGVSSE